MFLFLSRELSSIYKIQILLTHSVNFKVFSFSSGCMILITFMLIFCSSGSCPPFSPYSDCFIELLVYPSS
jgi:zinc transporter ZupT